MEHCFVCDTAYGYLGTTPHDGACPECGAAAVTPAGTLDVVDTTVWESANGLSTLRITAVDAGTRRFEFEVAARRGHGTLVRLAIEGVAVPTEAVWSVPPAVATVVTQHGIRIADDPSKPTPC